MEFPIGYEHRNSFRWAALAGLFLLLLLVAFFWPGPAPKFVTPAPHPYNSWNCASSGHPDSSSTLRLLGMSGADAGDVQKLCDSPAIAARFDGVNLRWKTDDEAQDATFLNMKYDVLAVKPSRLHNEEIGMLGRYTEIARYGPYEAWLIARGEMPQLNAAWFAGRRLGLGPPLSESGRRVLLTQLARLDEPVRLETLQCRGYSGHAALRDAFEAGEIDVFPSFWAREDARRFPDAQRLSIRDTLKPVTWYLRTELVDTDVHCAIVGMLENKARGSYDDYFKSLQVVRSCR